MIVIQCKKYVVGFMFSQDKRWVALIRKLKPEWQKGLLNGIGGKTEAIDHDRPIMSMIREFREETGCSTAECDWAHFAKMSGDNDNGEIFSIDFFVTTGDLAQLVSVEEEKIVIIPACTVSPGRTDVVANLTWLVPLALDHLDDGRPSMVTAVYPAFKPK